MSSARQPGAQGGPGGPVQRQTARSGSVQLSTCLYRNRPGNAGQPCTPPAHCHVTTPPHLRRVVELGRGVAVVPGLHHHLHSEGAQQRRAALEPAILLASGRAATSCWCCWSSHQVLHQQATPVTPLQCMTHKEPPSRPAPRALTAATPAACPRSGRSGCSGRQCGACRSGTPSSAAVQAARGQVSTPLTTSGCRCGSQPPEAATQRHSAPLVLPPLRSRRSRRTWLMPLASRASCGNEAAEPGASEWVGRPAAADHAM